ncbi:hypothetical protein L1987_54223 [Smallanthus sonchifolius]|uniref:Uncharacterized protein n=1 Tax=Smallanthus sonchifolius TaxID=185202 RepID=A0ACB9E660_9ASTR|nr:hypothetical protein L1987_54223 [Smallanthus sonchifolius]
MCSCVTENNSGRLNSSSAERGGVKHDLENAATHIDVVAKSRDDPALRRAGRFDVVMGIEKKTAKLQGREKAAVARYEAGHAVVGTATSKLLTGQPRIELRGRLVTLLSGRAAEKIIYSGRVSTDALDDIPTDMAYMAIAEYGLNRTIGPVSLATLSNGGMDDSGGFTLPASLRYQSLN